MSATTPSLPDTEALAIEQDRMISSRQVRAMLPVSTTTLWRWTRNPSSGFPKPARINDRLFWRLSEIRRWLAEKQAA